MTNRKITKRALLASLMSMLLCVTMLVGTTFAWFTDSASAGVNKIVSGTLDVALVDKDENSLEGEVLSFSDVDGNDDILWEPGCTYVLPDVYVQNNGNLALKYTVVISGINGDAKLNEVIEWTIGGNGGGVLLADESSGAITISGHMKESAGNEYQGLTMSGIGITVYATQTESEYDSTDNTYDKDAMVEVDPSSAQTALNNAITGSVVVLADGEYTGEKPTDSGLELKYNVGERTSGTGTHADPYITVRAIDDLTIVGSANARVDGFTIERGFKVLYNPTFYVTQIQKVGTLTLSGMTLTNTAFIYNNDGNISIENLVFENVTFDMAGKTASAAAHIVSGDGGIKNIVFKNCTFINTSGVAKPIAIDCRSVDSVNITVTGCTFDASSYNAMQLGGAGGVYAGNIIIKNNEINNTVDRGIRVSAVSGNVVISDNVLVNAADSDGEAIKVDPIQSGASVTVSGNTLNGNPIVFVDGVGK